MILVKGTDYRNFAGGPEADNKFKKLNTGNYISEGTHLKQLGTGEEQVPETRDIQETELNGVELG